MESQDYETNRNLTLMFFLEKLLVEKSGQYGGQTTTGRSLHDLSCQFGTKGFSREMRQIAGGSQAGLRKFLLQYPSLFTIDGELVSITQTRPPPGSDGGHSSGTYGSRDYTREAIDYFKDRMKAYGPGTEVPIKSLLGHRSQAPPEVRHISGQHVKEFREFLAKFPEEFVVREEDDVIYLKEDEGKVRRQCNPEDLQRGEGGAAKIDPRLTAKILSFVREILLQNSEMELAEAFDQTVQRFSGGGGTLDDGPVVLPFKRCQDFDTFLKMHSHLFRVQAGMVTLVPLKTQYIHNPPPTPPSNVNQDNNVNAAEKSSNSNGSSSNNLNNNLNNVNNAGNSNNISNSSNNSRNAALNQSLKQRVNSVVLKALADNSDRDRRSSRTLDGDPAPPPATSSSGPPSLQMSQRSPMMAEPLSKDGILRMTRVVMSARESQQIVDQIMRSGGGQQQAAIGVDGEGINLGTKGQLTLLQVSTMDKQAYIFDLLADPNMWIEGGLKRLLSCPDVVKVFHDCRNDSGVLHAQNDILLQNVFDTQAAHAVLELQEFGKPVYKVKNVSLNALCENYNASCNPIKDQIKAVYRRDQRFWARRPLTVDMICYAAADVLSLVPEIYQAMKSAMKPEFVNLFGELCEEQVMLYIDPEGVKTKKKQRKIDFEISDLRLKLANTSGKSIVLSNREIRLLRHVELTEEDKERLKGSYKVAKKLEKLESKQKQNAGGGVGCGGGGGGHGNGVVDSDDDSDDRSNRDDEMMFCVNNSEQELPSLESIASDGSSDISLMSSPALRSPFATTLNGGAIRTSPVHNNSSSNPSSLLPNPLPFSSNGGGGAPQQQQPFSVTESMEVVNRILADSSLDRTERIEKLESILTDMTEAFAASAGSSVNGGGGGNQKSLSNSSSINGALFQAAAAAAAAAEKVSVATQTVSTGDINITKVYSEQTKQ